MRRAIFAILVTAVGLVLLLSFKPHELTAVATPPSAASPAPAPPSAGSGGQRKDPHDEDEEGGSDDDEQTGITHQQQSNGTTPQTGQDSTAPQAAGAWTGPGAVAGATSGDKVITGDIADTRWGPVQVQLVLNGGTMTGIRVLRAPDGNHRDLAINSQALPTLNDQALAAQSAQIDAVSGATYTSEGYMRSLQSALDRAGL
ncbi:unnamed protein product [[Actinomadura] parvosata subsp. kistnae]|uniref:FMN-binding domain-containing protein n=1 Tax=[Actinomadura] parvosata subsp. kistnae TaxID=1909395 RepID=A0A1U9ZZ42_9ACTN|nr:FMN-binding protein [Nonomuraea sp. ATCC 55076]AQZ63214.1 hypothetical protein BKM31_18665 [Nonomuraea sp. ATCC 55076]SPL98885.1 unnamed protein product [Actinomadura parvosata subsp. kistnae]